MRNIREHPTEEQLRSMSTDDVVAYAMREADFLGDPNGQKQTAVPRIIRELAARARQPINGGTMNVKIELPTTLNELTGVVLELVRRYPEVFVPEGGGCIDIAAHISYDPESSTSVLRRHSIQLRNANGLVISHGACQHEHELVDLDAL